MKELIRRLPDWATLLLIMAIIFGVPTLISNRITSPLGTDTVKRIDPDYVFIGNSMLETRIDLDHFEDLAGGGKAISFADGGLRADAWYLRLKNFVVDAGAQPDVVFVFFRDDALTDPCNNPTREQFDSLQRLMGEFEPEYDTIVETNSDLTDELHRLFTELYAVQERRSTVTEAVQRFSASTLMPGLLTTTIRRGLSIYGLGDFDRSVYRANLADYERLKRDTNTVFDRDNLRQADNSSREPNVVPVFEDVVATSFLPLMVGLGNQHDIQLIFVRVQRRPAADGSIPGSASLDLYIDHLSDYLEASDAGFIDMNGDQNIRLEHYLDTDHITPGYMSRYTEIFFEKVSGNFGP
jgi:hypothetical protein